MKKLLTPIVILGIALSSYGTLPDLDVANKITQATKGTPDAIDGIMDSAWDSAIYQTCEVDIKAGAGGATAPDGPADFSGGFRTLWDDTGLYIFVSVTDDVLPLTTGNGFEVYTSSAYTRTFGEYANSGYDGVSDTQIQFKFGTPNQVVHGLYSYNSAAVIPEITLVTVQTAAGWDAEAKIPWSVILGSDNGVIFEDGIFIGGPDSASVGDEREFMGFEVVLQDEDDGDGTRDHKLAWFGGPPDRVGNFSWADTQVWGTLELVTAVVPPVVTPIFATGCTELWAVYEGGFKYADGVGFIYDGFFPYVYDFDGANWFYVFDAETASETDGYFIYDFGRSQFGYLSCALYSWGYAVLPAADPQVYVKLNEPIN